MDRLTSRDQFRKAFKRDEVEIEGFGVVLVREISSRMGVRFLDFSDEATLLPDDMTEEEKSRQKRDRDKEDFKICAEICLEAIIDEEGNRLFDPSKSEDYEELVGMIPPKAVREIANKALSLSGMVGEAAIESQEDAKKKSVAVNGALSGASPTPSDALTSQS